MKINRNTPAILALSIAGILTASPQAIPESSGFPAAIDVPNLTVLSPEQSKEYQGSFKSFEITDLAFPAGDYPGVPDLAAALEGSRLILARHKGYCIFAPVRKQGIFGMKPAEAGPIPPAGRGAYYGACKFRQGSFFTRSGTRILKYNKSRQAWESYFTARKLFSQFEILPGGRILLVCPTARAPLESPWAQSMEMTVNKGEVKLALAEIHSVHNPGGPERTIPYPAAIEKTLDKANNVPLIDATCQIGAQYLLINSQVGQIYAFDSATGSMNLVETPWPRLDSAYLLDLEETMPRPLKEGSVIKVSSLSFPWKIIIHPQNVGTALITVLRHSGVDAGFVAARVQQERALGNDFAPLPRIYTETEKEAWAWREQYIYDVRSRRLSPCRTPALAALRCDPGEFWLTPAGGRIPLESLGLSVVP